MRGDFLNIKYIKYTVQRPICVDLLLYFTLDSVSFSCWHIRDVSTGMLFCPPCSKALNKCWCKANCIFRRKRFLNRECNIFFAAASGWIVSGWIYQQFVEKVHCTVGQWSGKQPLKQPVNNCNCGFPATGDSVLHKSQQLRCGESDSTDELWAGLKPGLYSSVKFCT